MNLKIKGVRRRQTRLKIWKGLWLVVVLFISMDLTDAVSTELKNEIEDADECLGRDKEPICLTPGCIHAASDILKTIDESVDPCIDFYQFACGKFLKQTIIPDDKLMVMKFTDINDRVTKQLRAILEEDPKTSEPSPFVLLKNLYNVCMNTTAIEEDNLQTIKQVLRELGGWPALEGRHWDETKFDWMRIMYKLRQMGVFAKHLLTLEVGQNSKNASQRIIGIDEADVQLNREYLVQGFESPIMQAYYDYFVDLAVIFGAERELASEELKESLEFQIKLAKITLPQEERRNFTALTNFMTVAELQQQFPSIPWLEYANNIIAVPGIKISREEMVDVSVPKFITKLELLLSQTPKRVQANYIISNIVNNMAVVLTKQVRDRQFLIQRQLFGSQKMTPRWKECVVVATQSMKAATGALYVHKYFNEDAKTNAMELVSNLRTTFIDMLKQVGWMDENTKAKAIEKAAAMTAHIAYPNELLDKKNIEEHYAKLKSSENYLRFLLNVLKFTLDNSFQKLRKPVNKTSWEEHSDVTQVNAAYSVLENSILLPAGILQEPIFKNDRPHYMNYGGLGFVIGHEITHGFDDRGRQCDKDGILVDWWEEETANAYNQKAQCIIHQYGNFTASEVGMNLNGINTQGENIADNGGIKEAYLAYNGWVGSNGEEPRLPGLNYTPKQMFWISAANVWCSKQRQEYLKDMILTDDHPPAYFRIIGAFMNSEFFSQDFNCPIGSKMNPEHKCHVW